MKEKAWLQSHAAKAPLTNILGLVNVLELDCDESDTNKMLLTYLRASATNLDKIIRQIAMLTLPDGNASNYK